MNEAEEVAIKNIIHKHSLSFTAPSPKMKPEELVGLTLEEIMQLEKELQAEMRAFTPIDLDKMTLALHKHYKRYD